MGKNACTGPSLQPRQISRMIKMPVREEDGFDGTWLESKVAQPSSDKKRFTKQSRINHHTLVTILKQVTAAHDTANAV